MNGRTWAIDGLNLMIHLTLPMAEARGFSLRRRQPSDSLQSGRSYACSTSVPNASAPKVPACPALPSPRSLSPSRAMFAAASRLQT